MKYDENALCLQTVSPFLKLRQVWSKLSIWSTVRLKAESQFTKSCEYLSETFAL